MIEKFTQEELDIIREELKNLPKDYMKRSLCSESFHRMYNAFKKQDSYDGIYCHDVSDALLMVADFTFCNYEKNPKNMDRYRRSTLVRKEYGEEYKQFIDDVVTLIEKNIREKVIE